MLLPAPPNQQWICCSRSLPGGTRTRPEPAPPTWRSSWPRTGRRSSRLLPHLPRMFSISKQQHKASFALSKSCLWPAAHHRALLVPVLQSARRVSHPAPSPGGLPAPARPPAARARAAGPSSDFWRIKDSTQLTAELGFPSNPPPCVPLASLGFLAPARPEGCTRRGPAARSAPKPSRMAEPKGRALPSRGPRILPDRTRRGSPSPAEAAPDPPRRRLRSRPRPRCAAPRAAGGQQGWGRAAGFWGVRAPWDTGHTAKKSLTAPEFISSTPPPFFFF